MTTIIKTVLLNLLILIILIQCSTESPVETKGRLYIIGGGNRPASMLNEIIDISGLREGGYMFVLPMATKAAAIENPGLICAAIDESTALIIDGNNATVTGISQVVVIRNRNKNVRAAEGLLGAEGLEFSVYLPGDSFSLR